MAVNNNAAALILVLAALAGDGEAGHLAASWSRSAALSASRTSWRRPARRWSRWARPTGPGARTTSARSGRGPPRSSACTLELRAGRVHRAARLEELAELAAARGWPADDLGSGAWTRSAASRPCAPRSRRGRPRVLRRQAARRPPGRHPARPQGRSRALPRIRWPARCGSTSCSSRRWRPRCAAPRPRRRGAAGAGDDRRRRGGARAQRPIDRRGDRGRRDPARRRSAGWRRPRCARAPGPGLRRRPGAEGPERLAARLRRGEPPIVARIAGGRLVLDPRTMSDADAELAVAALAAARGWPAPLTVGTAGHVDHGKTALVRR